MNHIPSITTVYGTVYFSDKPTPQDRNGCDGIYVRRVVISRRAKQFVAVYGKALTEFMIRDVAGRKRK